jgi:hypothetical protein
MNYKKLIASIITMVLKYEAENNKKPIGIVMNYETKVFLMENSFIDSANIYNQTGIGIMIMGVKLFISNDQQTGVINLVI